MAQDIVSVRHVCTCQNRALNPGALVEGQIIHSFFVLQNKLNNVEHINTITIAAHSFEITGEQPLSSNLTLHFLKNRQSSASNQQLVCPLNFLKQSDIVAVRDIQHWLSSMLLCVAVVANRSMHDDFECEQLKLLFQIYCFKISSNLLNIYIDRLLVYSRFPTINKFLIYMIRAIN